MDYFKVYNAAIKKRLKPFLAAHQFTLTKSTRRVYQFQKINDHFVYCVAVYIFSNGSSLRIDLGVTLDFFEKLEGISFSKDIADSDCEFRISLHELSRYMPGTDIGSLHPWGWKLDMASENVQQAETLLQEIISVFSGLALPYFEQFQNFPEPLQSISLQDIETRSGNAKLKPLAAPLEQRLALTLARMYLYLNRRDEANQFAKWGLDHLDKAIGLKPKFVKLLEGKLV